MRRLISGLPLGFLVVLCACQALAQPSAAPATVPEADDFTGTILFIHGQPHAAVPVAVAELRGICVSRLEAALRGKGHQTADRAVMEAQVRKWRVRDSHLVSREFLAELRRDHRVGRVLVVTLLADNGRFLMAARLIETATGRLLYAELKDVDLLVPTVAGRPETVPDWHQELDRICGEITPPWSRPAVPRNAPLLTLPTRGIGSDPEITSAAAHSLLKTLLAQGVDLLDPALAEVAMLGAGQPSHWLDPHGRGLLRELFGRKVLLISELVSYDSNNSFAVQSFFDPDLPGPGRRSLTVFAMTLRMVDLDTGTAVRSAQIMHEKPPATGWFGNPIRTTLLIDLESTTHELWAAFSPESED